MLAVVLATAIAALVAGCANGKADSTVDGNAVAPGGVLERDFAIFRRSRSEADEIPKSLLPSDIADSVGLDLKTSRLARRYKGDAVYVVTSPRFTCTYSRSYEVGNCWPTSTVVQGLATATSICGLGTDGDEIVTYGIVPDGVREVTILRDKEPDRTVQVVGNVYVAATSSTPPLPRRLEFEEDGKRVVRSTGIPPALARQGCPAGKPSRPPGSVR